MHNGMEEHNNLISLGGRSLSLTNLTYRGLDCFVSFLLLFPFGRMGWGVYLSALPVKE